MRFSAEVESLHEPFIALNWGVGLSVKKSLHRKGREIPKNRLGSFDMHNGISKIISLKV